MGRENRTFVKLIIPFLFRGGGEGYRMVLVPIPFFDRHRFVCIKKISFLIFL